MFKLKRDGGRAGKGEKRKFPEHSRKLFSLDSFKSRHPVLEFSNHHQRNLQSEHTASQFNPAHLLTLAAAEPALRPTLCVCVCTRLCALLCGPVCVLLPFETRSDSALVLDK